MLAWLKARAQTQRNAKELYGAVVAAARSPHYYSDFRVADTPEGRFEMIALMLFLVLERVKGIAPGGQALAQGAIEALVTDMDDCMREMGVGDLTVPKKVKRAAAAFYERGGAYRAALATPASATDPALAAALTHYVYQGRDVGTPVMLAHDVRRLFDRLSAISDEAALSGDFAHILSAEAGEIP